MLLIVVQAVASTNMHMIQDLEPDFDLFWIRARLFSYMIFAFLYVQATLRVLPTYNLGSRQNDESPSSHD